MRSGATINDSSLVFKLSKFKLSGAVSLTGSSHISIDGRVNVDLVGDTTLSASGSVTASSGLGSDPFTWPRISLMGNALTLNVNNMTIRGSEGGSAVQSIGTGESINSGSSNLNLYDNLTIDNGGILSSDNGSVTLNKGLVLNDGELRQGGGILNLISGGSVGTGGRLDVSDSELKLGSALSITGTLAAVSYTHLTLPTILRV